MSLLVNPYRLGSAAPTTLLYDTFTDSNSTALSSHTPDTNLEGGSYSAVENIATIQSNRARGRFSTGEGGIIECGESDITLTAIGYLESSAGQFGPVFRGADANNFWYFRCRTTELTLFEKTGGTYTPRATGVNTLSVTTDYEVVVVCSGTSIECTINGVTVSFTSSAHQTNTKHGIRMAGNNTVGGLMDNLLVTT